MNSKKLKQRMLLTALAGTLLIPGSRAYASDATEVSRQINFPNIRMEMLLKEYRELNINMVEDIIEPVIADGEFLKNGYAEVNENSFLHVRSEPSRESEWVGRLYPGYAAKVTGESGEWLPIESGSVEGYVYAEYLITGEEAREKTREILDQAREEDTDPEFQHAITREEVEERQREEEELRIQQLQEAIQQGGNVPLAVAPGSGRGQDVVNFALQFVGNPYSWGGTSLTHGADCSGFVQSVFAHFGVSVPRTSREQRYAGVAVSFEQRQPGDLFCYEGHVGIYIGNGQIVHAMNYANGIGVSSATFTRVITIRRLL